MVQIQEEFYHGWLIQIAEGQLGYVFYCYCWMENHPVAFTEAQPYATVGAALQAARLRADLESVRSALTTFLNGKRQFLLLHPDECNALENSIADYIDTASHQLS